MTDYEIQIKDLDGNIKGVFTNFQSLKFSHTLNREGYCRFTISLSDPKVDGNMIQIGKREVYVYREGTRVWGGILTMVEGALTSNNDMMTVYAKGFMEYFKARYTDDSRIFTSTDAGEIAWTLIDESQSLTNGSFGITEGTIETSVDRDRTYEYKNIYDAIVQLSEVNNGFDFEITAAKEFNVYYPMRGDDLSDSQILKWGKNIKEVKKFVHEFTEPVNEVTVLGTGLAVETRTDSQSKTDYNLRQLIYPYKEVEGASFLQAKGDEILNKGKVPRREYEIVQIPESYPTYGVLQMGDWVRVEVSHGSYLEIADVIRINQMIINVEKGKETITYNFQYD